jgi:hypothetical protein
MAETTKPRPKNTREVLDEMLGNEAVDPTSGRPAVLGRNRGNDVSTKGDRVKDVSISIVDIDTAIIKYIEEKIKPSAIQDGNRIMVPIMYGYPERWSTIQEKGYLREYSGRFVAPVIVLKRDSLEANRSLGSKLDANNPQNFHIFETSYTKKNQYDNFSVLGNREPVKEFRVVVMPEYVTLKYSAVIFTNHLEQNNKIIEALQYAANTYWGEVGRFQFRANIDSFTTSTEYSLGTDRTTRTNFGITLNGYIIPDTINRDLSYTKKFISKAQVVFNLETDDQEIFTIGAKPKNTVKKQAVNFPTPGQNLTVNNISTATITYLNTNITKTASSITTPDTATFNNTSILQPPSEANLPSTTVNDFRFFINGQYIPSSIVTLTQSGSNLIATFNTTALGYVLSASDEIIAIGKFN